MPESGTLTEAVRIGDEGGGLALEPEHDVVLGRGRAAAGRVDLRLVAHRPS